jgi:beta-glucosidase
VSSVDPTAIFPFGHGLSFAPPAWLGVKRCSEETWATDGTARLSVTLRNDAAVPTAEVVQVYLHDVVAEVARPTQQLIAAQRVELGPGEVRSVMFTLHADLTSYVGIEGRRIVDEGEVVLQVGASSRDTRSSMTFRLEGGRRYLGFQRVARPEITVFAGEYREGRTD